MPNRQDELAAPVPTETSPLLTAPNGHDPIAMGDAEGSNGIGNGSAAPKKHPMADKMHLLLPAVGIGIFLVAVDQLLAVATYARIGSELKALNSTSWIATAYFLTLTSCQPLYGKLSDIFGRKECLLFAYAVFAIGCLGCGLAQNMFQLCVARAVSGIGGGGMGSVVSILMSDIVPLRERGVWQGYLNLIYAAGTATGAPLGGLLADSIGWRWSFMAQTPLCVIAWISVYYVLRLQVTSHDHWLAKVRQIDFLGAFTLIIAVIALLVGLDCGSNLGWSHPITIIALAVSPVLFAIFVFVEVKVASHPFAPGHIIFDGSMFSCYCLNFLLNASQLGVIFFLPLYFQAVEDLSTTVSSSFLVPATLASVLASMVGGWVIKRTGKYYWPTIVCFTIMLLSLLPLCLSIWKHSMIGINIAFVLFGVGGGTATTTTLIALLANAAPEDSAVVIACSYLFRSLGSSIGISVSAAVFQQVLRSQLLSRMSGDEARHIEEQVRQSLDIIKRLPELLAIQVRESYRFATLGAYVPGIIFAVICFIVSFWVREKSLKR